VQSLIEDNNRKFGSDNIRFSTYDHVSNLLKADVVVSKDVMQHLPISNIIEYIEIFRKNYKFLLITNDIYPDDWLNVEIHPGECRSLNLKKDPFKFYGTVIFRDAFITHGIFVEKEGFLIKGSLHNFNWCQKN
jgi:hypothetical protein